MEISFCSHANCDKVIDSCCAVVTYAEFCRDIVACKTKFPSKLNCHANAANEMGLLGTFMPQINNNLSLYPLNCSGTKRWFLQSKDSKHMEHSWTEQAGALHAPQSKWLLANVTRQRCGLAYHGYISSCRWVQSKDVAVSGHVYPKIYTLFLHRPGFLPRQLFRYHAGEFQTITYNNGKYSVSRIKCYWFCQ